MPIKKPLAPCEQYYIDDFGRICPSYEVGWAKIPWKDEPAFEDAIEKIAASPVLMDDISTDTISDEEWLDLLSKKYLCIEDGFFLATGTNAQYAVFRFEFGNEVFFNFRPDFQFLTLVNDFNEAPINAVESVVHSLLLDHYREAEAISRAISVGEIDPLKLYPIKTWLDFWESRGITAQSRSLMTPKSEKPFTETERQTMLKLIIGMAIDAYGYNPNSTRNSATGDKNGISAKLQAHRININDDTIRKYLTEAKELL